jgi:Predicted integral membrane protein
MSGYITDPLGFLIKILFDLYILALMLRFLLQLVRADYYNPICQFLVRITDPALSFIPAVGRINLAPLVLVLVLQMMSLSLIAVLEGVWPGSAVLFLSVIRELLSLVLNIFFFTILAQVILSWVNPRGYHHHPATSILHSLNEPLLRPVRRVIPPVSGLDLSPLVVLITLQLIRMLLLRLLTDLANAFI